MTKQREQQILDAIAVLEKRGWIATPGAVYSCVRGNWDDILWILGVEKVSKDEEDEEDEEDDWILPMPNRSTEWCYCCYPPQPRSGHPFPNTTQVFDQLSWFKRLIHERAISEQRLYRRWHMFCTESGHQGKPYTADQTTQRAFVEWLNSSPPLHPGRSASQAPQPPHPLYNRIEGP
jgi:hypothetical protein